MRATRQGGITTDRTVAKMSDEDWLRVLSVNLSGALRTNPNGSGISLGHPLAATGAILVVKALYELRRTAGRYALVTMCIGGGQGIVAIFERM